MKLLVRRSERVQKLGEEANLRLFGHVAVAKAVEAATISSIARFV